eukprot:gnl/MRDRNA2_/MRDRNA2_89693_c0_seq1.p1 gnl/MRDRNA2_/MRDRNA2_89693_c0~~gnl/MRDRNA2_/MRDRNA2_89693_c0_seq1.p1  ORF type:complete len:140 (+),score=21.05 gnl/MRDRNA2_/MRDRNA2_89693_c0_seq1:70-489(+)
MMKIIVLSFFAIQGQSLSVARQESVAAGAEAAAADPANPCEGMECAQIVCPPPFVVKTPDDMQTCCPICASDIKVPEDRPEGLTGGIGPANKADPVLCRGVVCLPLDCAESDQVFDDRCCTKCKDGYTGATGQISTKLL